MFFSFFVVCHLFLLPTYHTPLRPAPPLCNITAGYGTYIYEYLFSTIYVAAASECSGRLAVQTCGIVQEIVLSWYRRILITPVVVVSLLLIEVKYTSNNVIEGKYTSNNKSKVKQYNSLCE